MHLNCQNTLLAGCHAMEDSVGRSLHQALFGPGGQHWASLVGRLRLARRDTILNVVLNNVWLLETPADHLRRSRESTLCKRLSRSSGVQD